MSKYLDSKRLPEAAFAFLKELLGVLFGAEDTIAGIAEAGNDVAVLV